MKYLLTGDYPLIATGLTSSNATVERDGAPLEFEGTVVLQPDDILITDQEIELPGLTLIPEPLKAAKGAKE